jgi:hypothetical protein
LTKSRFPLLTDRGEGFIVAYTEELLILEKANKSNLLILRSQMSVSPDGFP